MGITSVGTPASTRSLTLGIRVKFDLTATSTSLRSCDGSALVMVRFTNAAGPRPKGDHPAAFSMPFCWCVLYLHTHPRARPRTTALPWWRLWYRGVWWRHVGLSSFLAEFFSETWLPLYPILGNSGIKEGPGAQSPGPSPSCTSSQKPAL